MSKKVLVYNDSFLKYSETFIYNQLKGVLGDFDCSFLAHERLNADKFPFEASKVIRYDPLQKLVRLFNPFRFSPITKMRVRQWLSELSPDLIHVHFGTHALKIIPIARSLGFPVLVTFWGSDASKRLRSSQYVRHLIRFLPDVHVICCSGALRNYLDEAGVDVSRTGIHYVGVSTSKFQFAIRQPIAEKLTEGKTIHFLQVGRFVGKKGHATTLKAFAKFVDSAMKGREEQVQLHFIGSGPLENEMRELTQSLGIQQQVKFLGVKSSDEVQMHMSEADVLLQHSVVSKEGDMEGLPIVIMEAMATGLPVVSTYHSGIPELISHEKNGFLVQEHDVDSYAEVLAQVITLPDDTVNRAARRKIEADFDLDKQNKKLSDLYHQLMASQ